ncbi:hypothetical protein [Streptomyces sp. NPDC048606]|uniref:hypothetical protein n=1 Tax=Streptomyces sp. NPDC048606 TaxID=3154726 RepID=UPI00343D2CF9
MSYNQPGPYGQQPQQPGPYGQQPPPPNPYGQQQPQPGYGYPQQAPPGVPPQGYPQQPPQPGYPQQPPPPPGYPQQPQQPSYGYQQPATPPYGGGAVPPQDPPKKSKTGLVIGAVVAIAAIGGGAWYFLGAGDPVSEDTKGYKLVAPESVGEFQKNPKYQETPMTDEEKKQTKAAGVNDAAKVEMSYTTGDPKNPLTSKAINLTGYWGSLGSPEKSVDAYFAALKLSLAKNDKVTVETAGTPAEFTPDGFKGAVMKCQEFKFIAKDTAAKGPKESVVPVCVWADYSTLASVSASDAGAILTGKPGYTLAQASDFAAKLYNTARVKK